MEDLSHSLLNNNSILLNNLSKCTYTLIDVLLKIVNLLLHPHKSPVHIQGEVEKFMERVRSAVGEATSLSPPCSRALVSMLAAARLTQLPTDIPGKAMEDGQE